ncbi:DMT family transporter [Eubacteriaceae bacterium ES2]|nr:DMT family transporter [Eubacteriaceae bacterium ES2]
MNRMKLIVVMLLWGSIGLFSRYIDLTPIQLAFSRAVLATLVLFVLKKKSVVSLNRRSVLLYCLSGALIGFAWVALFYGYNNTTIASAVIIYNMCPVYVMLAAPYVLKEKRDWTQNLVIIISLIGLILIVGMPGKLSEGDLLGKVMSGISGLLYAVIILINRKIEVKLESTTATSIQMLSAALILLPFVLRSDLIVALSKLNQTAISMIVILGVVHTGVAYCLYFSTFSQMKSIDIVVFSYLEPLFGMVFGVMVLHETLTWPQIMGAILILGSTFVGENIQACKRIANPG